jgi:hypothetical protein
VQANYIIGSPIKVTEDDGENRQGWSSSEAISEVHGRFKRLFSKSMLSV